MNSFQMLHGFTMRRRQSATFVTNSRGLTMRGLERGAARYSAAGETAAPWSSAHSRPGTAHWKKRHCVSLPRGHTKNFFPLLGPIFNTVLRTERLPWLQNGKERSAHYQDKQRDRRAWREAGSTQGLGLGTFRSCHIAFIAVTINLTS